jgi:hypothetical protein
LQNGIYLNNMRTILLTLLVFFMTFSCKKENDSLLPEYQTIQGTWKTLSMSYDSSGVRVTKSIVYDKMVIHEDLTYQIYHNTVNVIENGYVRIVSQTDSKLELFFEAHYPSYSSFAGSHIFSNVNVSLIKLTMDELVLRDVENSYFSPREFHFIKFQ